ncbi:uncharacterized protein BDZ99DRAFT_481200 [Mytilinidion resinicola]|uniref:Uncharacterized protein n=1 Tax=Mytilinidion resinicola TaxID=574789 RepID=A0A6A6Y6Q7_9PEZI|nr:uncharacterized protein BDZ99DRAFT_481200 [Mytilinidion resinicola]KAF2804370.1 hypothetical protein BDZ99DRAFT_481200 [Mytilinidion resinicola]
MPLPMKTWVFLATSRTSGRAVFAKFPQPHSSVSNHMKSPTSKATVALKCTSPCLYLAVLTRMIHSYAIVCLCDPRIKLDPRQPRGELVNYLALQRIQTQTGFRVGFMGQNCACDHILDVRSECLSRGMAKDHKGAAGAGWPGYGLIQFSHITKNILVAMIDVAQYRFRRGHQRDVTLGSGSSPEQLEQREHALSTASRRIP